MFTWWREAMKSPGDHLVVGLARADHRVHARVGVDHHLEERRALEVDELGDDPRHVRLRSRRTA